MESSTLQRSLEHRSIGNGVNFVQALTGKVFQRDFVATLFEYPSEVGQATNHVGPSFRKIATKNRQCLPESGFSFRQLVLRPKRPAKLLQAVCSFRMLPTVRAIMQSNRLPRKPFRFRVFCLRDEGL